MKKHTNQGGYRSHRDRKVAKRGVMRRRTKDIRTITRLEKEVR